jgi:hypothetical protein
MFVEDPTLTSIFPVSGPALTAGTVIVMRGTNFVNTSLLSCRVENETIPARFVGWP